MNNLVGRAIMASAKAYVPYSNYVVGACLETTTGERFPGCNIEAVTYSATNHAEESAIVNAIVAGVIERAGGPIFIKAMAVVTKEGGPPCGICLQRIAEHAQPDCIINCADLMGNQNKQYRLKDLLPQAFRLNK